jgi:cytochrome P450
MDMQVRDSWEYGAYTLTKKDLLPENQNKVCKVSFVASELIERLGDLSLLEVREMANMECAMHIVVDPDAQKLFLMSKTQDSDPAHREIIQKFFTKEKLGEFKAMCVDITKHWLETQVNQTEVLLFDSTHRLVCQCLIQGLMGYSECSDDDITIHTQIWKNHFMPTSCQQKTASEYKQAGAWIYDTISNAFENGFKICQYSYNIHFLDILIEKIYKETSEKPDTFCHYLKENGYEETAIIPTVKTILLAGQEKTGYLLGFMLYECTKNTYMQEKLARDTNGFENAFLELLRKYSVAGCKWIADMDMVLTYPGAAHETKEHYIRKNDHLICSPFISGHDETLWEDPEIFDPNRANLDYVKKNPHFGFGKRDCIGKNIAKIQIKTILKTILANAILLKTKEELPPLLLSYTLRPKHDIHIKYHALAPFR